ncbi:MAG: 5'-nucleotidase, lipoprotein e(P4) family [bacterium]|nr:5'-nucleotidase, lipoprotein e(P4) family [bacterium]
MKFLLIAISFAMLAVSCSHSRPYVYHRQTHELLHSVLWMQRSAEYRAACETVYLGAFAELERALSDTTWSAATEQQPPFGRKPPAIIVDVDETVLDNSPYEARLVLDGSSYPMRWDEWCCEEKAPALPGAVEFLREADRRGVAIFYVTNRDVKLDECTWRNLRAQGFPQTATAEQVMTKDEREGWGSDKSTRREYISRSHRVIQIAGDNLDDFVGYKKSTDERDGLANQYSAWWGTRWLMLPNPAYGSWERALLNYDNTVSDSVALRKKYDALRPER